MNLLTNKTFYSDYGQVQREVVVTCWILGYATVMVHNYKKSKMRWMVWTK
jgi:hypothetical protein